VRCMVGGVGVVLREKYKKKLLKEKNIIKWYFLSGYFARGPKSIVSKRGIVYNVREYSMKREIQEKINKLICSFVTHFWIKIKI